MLSLYRFKCWLHFHRDTVDIKKYSSLLRPQIIKGIIMLSTH